MLQEVLIMAKAEYFIIPVLIVFYFVSKGLKKHSSEKSHKGIKPIIRIFIFTWTSSCFELLLKRA